MKKITTFFLGTFLLINAFTQDGMSASSNESRNKKAAIEVFNALQSGDIESAFKHYDNKVLFSGNGGASATSIVSDSLKQNTISGRASWKEAFPDTKDEIISAAADGDYVMLYTRSSGTWKNNFGLWNASGKSYKMTDVTVYKFNENGKIIEVQRIMPQVSLMDQLGDGGEFDINKAGYALLEQKKYDEAIEVFKLNVKLYPKSSNVFDSLGEAYMLAGNKPKAIENYEKSVKMDPKNENGITTLKKLRN